MVSAHVFKVFCGLAPSGIKMSDGLSGQDWGIA
jgi:hypothetical protein